MPLVGAPGLGWPQPPPGHHFLLTSAPPLISGCRWVIQISWRCLKREHFGSQDFAWILLFSGIYHTLNLRVLHWKKPPCQRKRGDQGLSSFKWKSQTITKPHRICLFEFERVKICSLLKSKIKWNLQHLYTAKMNHSPSTNCNCYTSQGSICNLLSQQSFLLYRYIICFCYRTANSEKHAVHLSLSSTASNTDDDAIFQRATPWGKE